MITVSEICEKGSREINEDSIGWKNDGDTWCFAIADGLGGHGRGEVASELVVKCAMEWFSKNSLYLEFLPDVFCVCQKRLLERQKKESAFSEMKTTMVVCCVNADSLRWAHIGDSRLYLFERGRKGMKRTLDHSVPQMLVYAGEIRDKDIRFHPDRNRLMKVMGTEWNREDEYELSDVVDRKRKQAILMCTDGFWELIDEKAMQKCLSKAKDVEEWASLMKKIVLINGAGKNMDNYSAICIWLD